MSSPRTHTLRAVGRRLVRRSPTFRSVHQFVDLNRLTGGAFGLAAFVRDVGRYRRIAGAEEIRWRDLHPELHDRVAESPVDPHYFHQEVWAAKKLAARRPRQHTDVGSRVYFAGMLTAITQVRFVDIRPLRIEVEHLESISGSLMSLPFPDRSIESLSCLHVAEHVGLGRYGDPLDPSGTLKAAKELQRVVAPDGEVLFSCPVGRPRLCFNAHRIHDPSTVIAMFDELTLVELTCVDDGGHFRTDVDKHELAHAEYACGLFHFRRAL